MAGEAPKLPIQIITNILSRLPVKPLQRFKLVSKQFKSLISSPIFVRRHLTHTRTTNPDPNLLIMANNTLLSSPVTFKKFKFTQLNHPLRKLPNNPSVTLVDSYNGLTVAFDGNTKIMFLYNPSCSSHRLLPPAPWRVPVPERAIGLKNQYFGFGYDSLSDDYKLIRCIQWFPEGASMSGICREAVVYNLRDDVWKFVEDETMPYILQKSYAVAANDMLHFVAVNPYITDVTRTRTVLKCYDLRTDSFLIVDYPPFETNDMNKMSMGMRELRGCLCVLVNYQKPRKGPNVGVRVKDRYYNRQFLYADVWEMRERGRKESWVKLFRIQHRELVDSRMYLRHVCYSKDNKSLLLEVDGMWFGWYDLLSKRIKRVAVKGLRVGKDSHSVALTFVESLVSVNSDKLASKGMTMPPWKMAGFLSSAGFKLQL